MTDLKYMQLAIGIAKSTLGQTSPNPSVGAVIVKNGNVIGIGAHLQAGGVHAEINAMNNVTQAELIGATLYVTLEPCCHFGKTTPCTNAIIKNKIKRVVVATLDPNPLIAGAGVKQLQDAGIEVLVGILEHDAIQLNKMFFHYILTHTPYITIKAGMSLDAKLATSTRESKWVTNSESRADAHTYRHSHDAILVGVNSVIADDPLLTTRLKYGGKNPIRIILDTHLRTPINSQIVNDGLAKTIIVTGSTVNDKDIYKYDNSKVEILRMRNTNIDLHALLKILAERDLCSILVEGGPTIQNSFIQNKLFNELVMYIAPNLIGGENAPNFFAGIGFAKLSDSIKLKYTEVTQIGNDIKIVAVPISPI